MTPQSEKYVDGSAFTSVDDMRRGRVRLPPRPDSDLMTINEETPPMTDPTEPTRYAFEYPDEAGYPDGKGTLSQDQIVLIDELLDDPHVPAFVQAMPRTT